MQKEVDSSATYKSKKIPPNRKFLLRSWLIHLILQRLRLLPGEFLVGTEVAELGRLVVDRAGELELLGDRARSQVEVGLDNLYQLLGGLVRGAVRVDVDRAGLSDTNGVTKLD